MAETITACPKGPFFDASGKPLSGGCLFAVSPGSSVPVSIWTDSAGSVSSANPVQLDSAGCLQNQLFADGVVELKLYAAVSPSSVIDPEDFPGADWAFARSWVSGSDAVAASDVPSFPGVEALVSATPADGLVFVDGYYERGDCPVRAYEWDATSTAVADGGAVFASSLSASGRWLLRSAEAVLGSWVWGATGSTTGDVSARLTAAGAFCEANGRTLYFCPGTHVVAQSAASTLATAARVWISSGARFTAANDYTIAPSGAWICDLAEGQSLALSSSSARVVLDLTDAVDGVLVDSWNMGGAAYPTFKTLVATRANAGGIRLTANRTLTVEEPYAVTIAALSGPWTLANQYDANHSNALTLGTIADETKIDFSADGSGNTNGSLALTEPTRTSCLTDRAISRVVSCTRLIVDENRTLANQNYNWTDCVIEPAGGSLSGVASPYRVAFRSVTDGNAVFGSSGFTPSASGSLRISNFWISANQGEAISQVAANNGGIADLHGATRTASAVDGTTWSGIVVKNATLYLTNFGTGNRYENCKLYGSNVSFTLADNSFEDCTFGGDCNVGFSSVSFVRCVFPWSLDLTASATRSVSAVDSRFTNSSLGIFYNLSISTSSGAVSIDFRRCTFSKAIFLPYVVSDLTIEDCVSLVSSGSAITIANALYSFSGKIKIQRNLPDSHVDSESDTGVYWPQTKGSFVHVVTAGEAEAQFQITPKNVFLYGTNATGKPQNGIVFAQFDKRYSSVDVNDEFMPIVTFYSTTRFLFFTIPYYKFRSQAVQVWEASFYEGSRIDISFELY